MTFKLTNDEKKHLDPIRQAYEEKSKAEITDPKVISFLRKQKKFLEKLAQSKYWILNEQSNNSLEKIITKHYGYITLSISNEDEQTTSIGLTYDLKNSDIPAIDFAPFADYDNLVAFTIEDEKEFLAMKELMSLIQIFYE